MKILYFFLMLFVLVSCGGDSLPKGVYDEKKMRVVLWDVIRANELADFYQIRDTTWKGTVKRDSLLEIVCKIHKSSRAELDKSLNWYQAKPELFKTVLDSLKARQDTIHYTNISPKPQEVLAKPKLD